MPQTTLSELAMTGPSLDDADARLITRIASGDRDALGLLYERFQRPLFRYLVQLTADHGLAEEVLQDTLVAVWRGAAQYARRSRVQTWLIGIARRQALGRLRRRAPALADLDAVASVADPGPDPEARLLAEADREEVAAAIRRLSPAHREVLDLCFVQGLSYQEIADVLGAPLGTVKSRLNHAKRAVRLQLEGFREVEP